MDGGPCRRLRAYNVQVKQMNLETMGSLIGRVTKTNPNHGLTEDGGEASTSKQPSSNVPTVFIRSRQDDADPSHIKPMPEFDPDDLIGITILLPPQENGERLRAKSQRKLLRKLKLQMAIEYEISTSYLILVKVKLRN